MLKAQYWRGLLAISLFVFALPGEAAPDKKQALSELRARIEKLQSDLAKSEESRTEAADALRASEKAISEANRGLAALGLAEQNLEQELASIKAQSDAARQNTSRQQTLRDQIVRRQYQHGSADTLRLVLEGEDLARVERQLRYLGYVSKSRAATITALNTNLAQLAELDAEARAKREALAANAAEQKSTRQALEIERAEYQKVLTQVANDIRSGKREIGRLKRDEDRLSRLIVQLAKAFAKKPAPRRAPAEQKPATPRSATAELIERVADASLSGSAFAALRGRLKWPTRGELTGRFGAQRESGGVTWKGIFIRAGQGAPVRAVADGEVVFADWLRGFGNLLIVDHGGGYLSLYGNNETLLKQVGETTQSGETVASVGSTGGAAESGVYFELRQDGKPFDPAKWITK
jgi:septal ring factor EnvC (AmiA/AmiB activator)